MSSKYRDRAITRKRRVFAGADGADERTLQLFFQLTRPCAVESVARPLDSLLSRFHGAEEKNLAHMVRLYKLIGQTRDVSHGKGERQLAILQIWVWYQHYPYLALAALPLLLSASGLSPPLGSWKDVKHVCQFVRGRSGSEDHPLILHALGVAKCQLDVDWSIYQAKKEGRVSPLVRCSLLARWLPRERSRPFGWVFRKFAKLYFPGIFATAKGRAATKRATRKARAQLRIRLAALSEDTGTVEAKMTTGRWGDIDYARVPSQALYKYRLAFSNLTQLGEQRSRSPDRIRGAANYCRYLEAKAAGAQGKRCSVGQLVKAALSATLPAEVQLLNAQWAGKKAKWGTPCRKLVALLDTSPALAWSGEPYYTAVGLAIRVSEMSALAHGGKILAFGNPPCWIALDGCATFVEKVARIAASGAASGGSAFTRALGMLAERFPPGSSEAAQLTVVVLSDMQVDASKDPHALTMSEQVRALYAGAPRWPPRLVPSGPGLVFWNLRGEQIIPAKGKDRNLTLLAGHNSRLLGLLHAPSRQGREPGTALGRLDRLLGHRRYAQFESVLRYHFSRGKSIPKVNKNTGLE